ncbi:MAG: response regulator transcription factor [Bacteroidia bacterium]|nr:response regulator transcription factor [Bacteroidia bacterium]
MKESINIYLADDHQIVIDGLILLLKNEPDIFITGYANDGLTALKEIQNIKPDIALIDLRMPGKDGLQIIQSLRIKLPVKFIILSMHHDKRFITDAKNYGADAYLFKNTGRVELLETIRKVMDGKKCFPASETQPDQNKKIFLTPREMDVFKLVINGYTTFQIADKLSLSEYTIDTHRKSIGRKTGARNVIALLKYAIANNVSFDE